MSTIYSSNSSRFFSSVYYLFKDLTSATSIFHALTVILCFIVISAVSGESKYLQSILFSVDHLFGGATRSVSLPGPTGLPLVGNLYQMKDGHVQTLNKWIKKYGPVIRVALGEREAVFINNHMAMYQTIVAQGPAFQSRPTFKLFHSDFASSGIWTVGSSPYSDRLARTRKALSTQISPRHLPTYRPIMQLQLKRLLNTVSEMSKGPAHDMAETLHCFGTGLVSQQLVGAALPEPLIAHIVNNETSIFRQRTIGSPAHDYVPMMRTWNKLVHIITSTLGFRYCRNENEERAKEYRRLQQIYIIDLLAELRGRVDSGDEVPSILGNIMRATSLNDEEIFLTSYTGVASGVNLGYSLMWIVAYLANHQEMQERAYEAIRDVYNDAVPDPHDFDRVKYVKAVYTASTEGSRYYVPVRFGFPRQTVSEATYNGVTIPTGVMTVMNCFACNRDPAAYDSPDDFVPERWMEGHIGRTDTVTNTAERLGVPHLTFGAGRRVCPGIEMANRGLYSSLVLLFHFFKWERGVLGDKEKQQVFPVFRRAHECTAEMDPLLDTATPTEIQAIPWACGVKFTPRDPEALAEWLSREE